MSSKVFKSYIPGKGYMKATEVGAKGLRRAATDRALKAITDSYKPSAQGRKLYSRNATMGPGKTGTVRRYPENHPFRARSSSNPQGGLAMPDGKGGGLVFANDDLTFKHEMAHIRPRRNPHQMRQRLFNERKNGREEGRAEFEAHGHAGPTYPDYTQRTTDWRTGYEEVQNRMSRAQRRKKVQKSFIPGKGYVRAVDAGAEALREGAKIRASRGYDLTRMGKKGPQRMRLNWTGEIDPNDALMYQKFLRGQREALNVHHGAPTRIIQTKRGPVTVIEANPHKIDRNASAYAVHTGGRKGQRYLVMPEGEPDRVLAHELAHLSPKRSSFRMFQIHMKDRIGGEEARADMTGPSYYRTVGARSKMDDKTHSGYAAMAADPGYAMLARMGAGGISPRQTEHYRLVQDVIAEARGASIPSHMDQKLGRLDQFYAPAFGYKAPEPHPDLGVPNGPFHGNQYVDWQKRRRRNNAIKAGVWGGIGTGAGVAAYKDIKRKRSQVSDVKKALFARPQIAQKVSRLGSTTIYDTVRTGVKTPFNHPSRTHRTTIDSFGGAHLKVPGAKIRVPGGDGLNVDSPGIDVRTKPFSYTQTKKKRARPTALGYTTGGAAVAGGGVLAHKKVEKMSPREIPAVAGAHWTTKLSLAADRIEPYAAKRRKPIPRPVIDRHLPTVKRVGGKLVHTGRTKAAETLRAVSYDVSSLNDKDKLIREVATGQGRIGKSFYKGKYVKVTSMHPASRRALKNSLAWNRENRRELEGAKITYKKAPGTFKNGRPVLGGVHVEGPNVRAWGPRKEVVRRAKARGFNVDFKIADRDDMPGDTYSFKNTRTGKDSRLIGKSFQPWDGLHSEVSKMGPDPSELHVAGSSNQRRKARLRKLPPDAIRRV